MFVARCLRALFLAVLIVACACLGSTQTASAYCEDESAQGWITLSDGTTSVDVYIVDFNSDGIPSGYRCRGGSSVPVSLSPGQNNVSASGACTIAFDIWVGSSGENNYSAASGVPSAFFGGGDDDVLTGHSKADYLHGGESGAEAGDTLSALGGDDTVCPSFNTSEMTQTSDGGDGNDLMRGGPHPDSLNGDGDDDVVQGGAGDDICHGGADDDAVSGGPGDDEVYGDAGDDIVHGGKGFDILEGGDGSDIMWAQDYFKDDVVDPGTGGSDSDTCIYDDTADSGLDDPTADMGAECEASLQGRPGCDENDILAAKVISGNVRLYQLEPLTGDSNEDALLRLTGLGLATDVDGVAVHPSTCEVWAVLTYSSTQYLVKFASLAESTDEYTSTSNVAITKAAGSNDPLVDLDFDPTGALFGLESDAELVSITSGGAKTDVMDVGPLGTGVHMSFDDPDSGYFFVVTTGGGSTYEVYNVEPTRLRAGFVGDATDAQMPEALAMDWTIGDAGKWHQIASDTSMHFRQRRGNWLSQVHEDAVNCSGDPDDECLAAVASPQSATMAHWYVP